MSGIFEKQIKREVARLRELGLDKHKIAMALGCSVETVQEHLEAPEESSGEWLGSWTIALFVAPFVLVTGAGTYLSARDVLSQLGTAWVAGSAHVVSTDIFPDLTREQSTEFNDRQILWEMWVCFEFQVSEKTYRGYHHHSETSPVANAWRLKDNQYEVGAPIRIQYELKNPEHVYAYDHPEREFLMPFALCILSLVFFVLLTPVFLRCLWAGIQPGGGSTDA